MNKKIRDNLNDSKAKLQKVLNGVSTKSGIYVYTRRDESGKKYAYVGQAVNMIQRLASHDIGRKSHIDLSLKAHGYYNEGKPYGWQVSITYYDKAYLDAMEKYEIAEYGKTHYLYNVTAGGQGEGKVYLQPPAPRKGYREGVQIGKKRLASDLKEIIEKHLIVCVQRNNKLDTKALAKFWKLIDESIGE